MTQLKVWNGSAWIPAVVGAAGPQGPAGPTGAGFPSGGTTGQALVKKSGADYDTQWQAITTGVSSVDGLTGAVSLTNSYDAKGTSALKSKFDGFLAKATGPTNAFPTANTSLISSTSSSAISGASVYAYNSGKFYFRGLNASVITNGSGTSYYRNANYGYGTFWVEFDYYGSNFDIRYNSRGTNAAQIWVWIDGVPTTTSAVIPTSTNNVNSYYNVVLPSTAQRRIRVMLANADFGGIGLKDVTETIFPVEQRLLKVALFDGSWFAGGAGVAGVSNLSDHLALQFGEMLNVDYHNVSIGGTGYVRGTNVDPILGYVTDATASGANWCDPARLSIVTTINPDLVIFLGTTNDDGFTASSYRLGDHATYVYNYIKTNLPDTKIIVFTRGSNTQSSTALALNASTVYSAATAATNVIGAVNIYNEGWVTGTSNSTNPNNTGNGQIYIYSDFHLNPAGNRYYASRMFNRAVDIIKTYTRS